MVNLERLDISDNMLEALPDRWAGWWMWQCRWWVWQPLAGWVVGVAGCVVGVAGWVVGMTEL